MKLSFKDKLNSRPRKLRKKDLLLENRKVLISVHLGIRRARTTLILVLEDEPRWQTIMKAQMMKMKILKRSRNLKKQDQIQKWQKVQDKGTNKDSNMLMTLLMIVVPLWKNQIMKLPENGKTSAMSVEKEGKSCAVSLATKLPIISALDLLLSPKKTGTVKLVSSN